MLVLASVALPARAEMRITEYMYSGANGEFIEFTNVGSAPVDMTGWSFDDDSEIAGTVDLSAFGTVAAGESVILTETNAADFRTAWSLCDNVKVIGGNATNLGRDDEINLFDASSQLVDRLKYGDDTLGGPRTQNKSAWVSAAGLGANIIVDWTLSAVGDGETSIASAGGDIGSPGKSARASVPFTACPVLAGAMRITEYMYSGANGEFIEFTNVGNAALDLSGWSFSDSAEVPGAVDLSAYGSVAAGESGDPDRDRRRRVPHRLESLRRRQGHRRQHRESRPRRRDQHLRRRRHADRPADLQRPDARRPAHAECECVGVGGGLGANNVLDWTLSTVGDAEGSHASTGADIGSPGKSTRATVAFDPCLGGSGAPTITIDPAATSLFLDLAPTGAGTASGVIDDPTDPAATQGIGFHAGAARRRRSPRR